MAVMEIKRSLSNIPTAILAAGISNKMRSYEPRSLLKIEDETLVEKQIDAIRSSIEGDIILVLGYKANKVIRKIAHIDNIRIIENQNFGETNAAESVRLAVNNNIYDRLLIMHGDICINTETLKGLPYNSSFLLVDNKKMIQDREVGITVINNNASMLSYDLETKWCQIAYFTGREYQLLRAICRKDTYNIDSKLFFEIINTIISRGGSFSCFEPPLMKIFEIDSMNDLYENINS